MKVTWKNLSAIMFIIGAVVGYVIRFEVMARDLNSFKVKTATDLKNYQDELTTLKDGVNLLVGFQCKDQIDKAVTNEEKEKAFVRCKPFLVKKSI